jgi:hypothetical protein
VGRQLSRGAVVLLLLLLLLILLLLLRSGNVVASFDFQL